MDNRSTDIKCAKCGILTPPLFCIDKYSDNPFKHYYCSTCYKTALKEHRKWIAILLGCILFVIIAIAILVIFFPQAIDAMLRLNF